MTPEDHVGPYEALSSVTLARALAWASFRAAGDLCIHAMPPRTGHKEHKIGDNVEYAQFSVVRVLAEELHMVDEQPRDDDIDDHRERRPAGGQADDHEDGAHGIGDEREDEAWNGPDMERIGEMRRNLREVGGLLPSVLEKEA
jgi:hypothetical protein